MATAEAVGHEQKNGRWAVTNRSALGPVSPGCRRGYENWREFCCSFSYLVYQKWSGTGTSGQQHSMHFEDNASYTVGVTFRGLPSSSHNIYEVRLS